MGDDPLYAPLVRKLRNARDELREAVIGAVVEQSVAMRAAPADEVAAGLALVAGGLMKLLSGEPLSSTDRAQLRDTGRRWSALGIDTAAQVTAVRVASQVVHRFVLQAADNHRFARTTKDRRAAIEQVGDAMLNAVSVVQQAVVAHATGTNGSRRSPISLVDRILGAGPEQWTEVEALVAEAGLSGLFGLVIVLPEPDAPDDAAKVAARLVEHHDAKAGSLQPDPIPHVAVILGVADEAAWQLTLKHVTVDVADAGCELIAAPVPVLVKRLPLTYGLCRTALPYTAVLPSRSPVFDYSELQMCGLLAAIDPVHRQDVFEAIAGPLLERPDLQHLLDALVAIGPYEEVEAALGKPYRSITHNVKVIRKLTGHDWNEPRGRFLLTLITHLRWLAAMSLAEFDDTAWGPIPHFAVLRGAR